MPGFSPTTRIVRALLLGCLACGACAVIALGVGPAGWAWADLVELWVEGERTHVLREARLPRVILGALVGAALGASGAALQALLRNPLADPYIVGVSGGAALGGSVALALEGAPGMAAAHVLGAALVPAGAYLGALGVLALIYLVGSTTARPGSGAVLLCGIVLNAFCAALVSLVKLVVRAETAQGLMAWLMGSIGSEPWRVIAVTTVYVGVGLAALTFLAGPLHLLAQGDEAAARLGVRVERVRLAAYLSVSLIVAGVVSVTGLIGFVGLMVPHIVRLFAGADVRVVLPASALVGAGLMMLADAASRGLFPVLGTELPVGALTALLGGPVFLLLFRRAPAGRRP